MSYYNPAINETEECKVSLFAQLSSAAEQQARKQAGLPEKRIVRIRMQGHKHNGRIGMLKSIDGSEATVTIEDCVNVSVPYSALEDLSNAK